MQKRAKEGGINLHGDYDGNLPAVRADQRRVKQILINLLSNAIKFTPEGGQVTLKAEMSQQGCVAISVIDDGVGMSEIDLQKAMSQFGQADSGLNRKHEGTGLGLPLAKSLVDLHGGSFDIESTKDKGTKVTICLPSERSVTNQLSKS